MSETKHEKFVRLATQRGDRILRDIKLLSNLSNRKNYEYTEQEVRKIFSLIDGELRRAKTSFDTSSAKRIEL